jgi:glycosyltransferase involved in cell wall biosynthesis
VATVAAQRVGILLLVRNSVEHDARVLRAAHVAERELGGTALVVGVATASAPAGATTLDGIGVVRIGALSPALAHMRRATRQASRTRPRRPARQHSDTNCVTERVPSETTSSSPGLGGAARARRILSGLSFALRALLLARKVKPALVQANDWNTMWCGISIKFACGSRLVYDSHELWADRNGRWEWRPWLLACEALFVRVADEVLTSSPGYAAVLAARYRIRRPAVVRNIPEYRLADVSASQSKPSQQNGRAPQPHRVVYIGGLMPGRGLEQMIDALAFAPQVRLHAVGPGATAYRASLLARARSLGVERRIELCTPVAPAQVPDAIAGAAAGLCLIQPICRSYELCLPNKLFEYAAAGVPILASDVSVIATIVRAHGLGEVSPASEPQAIAASLERLLEPDRWRLAAKRTKEFASSNNWRGEADTLCGVYKRVSLGSLHEADAARRQPKVVL